jgi:hypothetical protein
MIHRLQALRKDAPAGIPNIASLRAHLQIALELELSTIPPYLCALYSLRDGSNFEVAALVRSVVMEEMLHVSLAANLLNAIGGAPDLTSPGVVPRYPTSLPHSCGSFQVNLLPFSRAALGTFLQIEQPAPRDARPQPDRYHTIGQFYAAIREGLKRLCKKRSDFAHRPECQVTPADYYNGHGNVIVVDSLESALRAIEEIVDQGEGFEHAIAESKAPIGGVGFDLAHYYRFNEILQGRRYQKGDSLQSGPTGPFLPVDWSAAQNMAPNPTVGWFAPGDPRRIQMEDCNTVYFELLRALQDAFHGHKARLLQAIPLMLELRTRAVSLMNIPCGIANTTLGPSFER